MKKMHIRGTALLIALLLSVSLLPAQNGISSTEFFIAEQNVRAHMEFLAGDALKGRGSGTEYELIAGEYLASQMRQLGIEPAGDETSLGERSYIQTAEIRRHSFAEAPTLSFASGGAKTVMTHGREMIVFRTTSGSVSGPLQKVSAGKDPEPGKAALIRYDGTNEEAFSRRFGGLFDSGASIVLVEETPQLRAGWDRMGARNVSYSEFGSGGGTSGTAVVVISKQAADAISGLEDGTEITVGGKLAEPRVNRTWNSVGMIRGSDPKLSSEVILLSAHMDHVGVRPDAPGEDKIFNGADDDASGCTAVIELARVLAYAGKPRRTVYFAFFGSEEAGGFGSRYFVANLPFPKEKLIANLQFEMLGRPDPKVGPDELWLTGYDRSNLGAELARQGAKLVNDPHPDQNFFQRSDNYTLARQGIIAHTVSSFGLHKDYHQASDELGTIDFGHMTRAINSMIKPVRWLVNSDFRPIWYEGKDPSR